MFGGKKRRHREETLQWMHMICPAITSRDLKLFGVLMKFFIDKSYDGGATPQETALCLGSLYFIEIVRCAEVGDLKYCRLMAPYAAWVGACADYIVNNVDFLTGDNRPKVADALERAKNLKMLPDHSASLGEAIDFLKGVAIEIRSRSSAQP
jgi:hypothetical protein